MSIFIDGLMTGLDTSSMIQQLMAAEAAPKAQLQQRQATYDKRLTAWASISANLSSLKTASNDILTPLKYKLFKASSSDATLATATASSTAAAGSFSFRVAALAASHQVMSQGFASTTSLVGAGTFTVGEGLAGLGFSTVSAGPAMTSGVHELKVIQASGAATAATYTGTAVTGLDWTNQRRIDITVNGQARSVSVAAAVYSSVDALAAAVQTAIGNDVQVSNVGGALRIATTATGAGSSLQITGGNGLTKAGWSAMGSPATGTAAGGAIVELDGVQTTIATVGQQYAIPSTAGALTLTLGSPLAVGTAKVYVAQTDSTTTLTGLATTLSNAGLSAQALDTGSGTATPANLVLSSGQTGTKNALIVNTGGLSGFGAGFTTLRAAADAQITLGNGGLTVTRSSNTITDVLPGVTINLTKADPTKDVTVTVDHDLDAVVTKVKAFVTALNATINTVKTNTKPGTLNADGKLEGTSAGTLWGDGGPRRLQSQLTEAMWYEGTGDIARAGDIGLELERDGTYSLDETKLREALAADFDGVVDFLAKDTTAGTTGLMGTMVAAVDALTATDGLVDGATKALQRRVDDVEDRIAAFDVRLSLIETRYRRQFASLETIVGQLKNQSSWLQGQIAQLPTTA